MIPGLFYLPNVIEDQTALLEAIDRHTWKPLSDSPNSRKVQHYGYLYDYKTKSTNKEATPIPDLFQPLISLLEQETKESGFNQVIINNYEPGQGISAHTDSKEYGAVIGCYTIGGGCVMKFTKGEQTFEHYVEPGSLYIMTGEARYEWRHEMPQRKSDLVQGKKIKRERRISITFRQK
jgi:alkylated DNA repair dioxygenase AlkB